MIPLFSKLLLKGGAAHEASMAVVWKHINMELCLSTAHRYCTHFFLLPSLWVRPMHHPRIGLYFRGYS
uniref:Uncharacterized protein n=1 Tax=Physcomitrium patens TaxID=3218 RepID=A0A2K1INB3_PHYPA|nr:hypothetical protein PHYPA_027088 [Physcomitrium patens]